MYVKMIPTMADQKSLPLLIYSRDRRELAPKEGVLQQFTWEKPERIRRAARTLGAWIGITFGCALIPFWHFVLVPLSLFLSVMFSMKSFEEVVSTANGSGTCPECESPLVISGGRMKDRYLETCGKCYHELEIRIQNADR